ncbi:hypothetical protein Tco_0511721, partial [Tanacetum coccineum]
VSEKLDDTPIRNTVGSLTAQMNFMSTNYPTKEELRGNGIKSPSKLLSPKYLSQSSLAEQNRNPSSPKRVYFVNSIVILNKEDKDKEEGNVKPSTTDYEDHEMTVESEEEFEEESEEEIKEEEEDSLKHFDTFPTMKELSYHEWLLKNPRPAWDTTSVIDQDLGSVVFEKLFVGNKSSLRVNTAKIYIFEKEDIASRKFLIKNEEEIFTVRGDGIGIKPDGIESPKPMIISSLSSYLYCFHRVNPKVSLYISYPANFTLGVVVFVFDLQVIFDELNLGSS